MVVTIQQVLHPLLIMCFIMGLGAYPMKQSNPKIQWITYLSILYRFTIWFSYAFLFYYTVTLFRWKTFYQNTFVVIITTTNICTTMTFVIISFYHQKRFEITLEKLSVVNDSLKKLGISKMYSKIHSCSKLIIIGWIVYSFVMNLCDIIWWLKLNEPILNSWGLLLPHILNYTVHVNAFVDLVFCFLLWYIGTRFDEMNKHIRCNLMRENYGYTWKKSFVALHRHLYLELCRITNEFNIMFGTQITFGMATHLLYITSLCYGLCKMITQKHLKEILQHTYELLNLSIWFFALFIRLYSINYICESVMVKANKIDKIIHELINSLRYADIRNEFLQFIFQVMHHPLKLTGMGLFYLGNECLRKFCMTVVTFVIIMVQMEVSLDG